VPALGNATTGALENDIEIHSVDARRWIVLKTQVNVLGDTEAETTCTLTCSTATKILRAQLELCTKVNIKKSQG
jgi:hypothetical protein